MKKLSTKFPPPVRGGQTIKRLEPTVAHRLNNAGISRTPLEWYEGPNGSIRYTRDQRRCEINLWMLRENIAALNIAEKSDIEIIRDTLVIKKVNMDQLRARSIGTPGQLAFTK